MTTINRGGLIKSVNNRNFIGSILANTKVVRPYVVTICAEDNTTTITSNNRHLDLVGKVVEYGSQGHAIVHLSLDLFLDMVGSFYKCAACNRSGILPFVASTIGT